MQFNFLRGLRARRLAEQLCRTLYPNEPLHGSWVCSNEPSRFVVRVFSGQRPPTGDIPWVPWAKCVIVAVDKNTWDAEELIDAEAYRPILR